MGAARGRAQEGLLPRFLSTSCIPIWGSLIGELVRTKRRRSTAETPCPGCFLLCALTLLTKSEPLDQGLVALDVDPLQIIELPAALAHQLEEATAGVVILLMSLEVLRELLDALGKERDLHLGRAGVLVVSAEFFDDFGLLQGMEHAASLSPDRQ